MELLIFLQWFIEFSLDFSLRKMTRSFVDATISKAAFQSKMYSKSKIFKDRLFSQAYAVVQSF